MKAVRKFQTLDGSLHDSERAAGRHAEKEYANSLCLLASKLVAIEKYSVMTEFLDSNLGLFRELQALKEDITLVQDEVTE